MKHMHFLWERPIRFLCILLLTSAAAFLAGCGGTLVCKRWNDSGDIVAYVNLDTKGKAKKVKGLKFTAFEDNNNYMGIRDIPEGSHIRVRYVGTKYYLRPDSVEVI